LKQHFLQSGEVDTRQKANLMPCSYVTVFSVELCPQRVVARETRAPDVSRVPKWNVAVPVPDPCARHYDSTWKKAVEPRKHREHDAKTWTCVVFMDHPMGGTTNTLFFTLLRVSVVGIAGSQGRT
jgi:hypothetical protein